MFFSNSYSDKLEANLSSTWSLQNKSEAYLYALYNARLSTRYNLWLASMFLFVEN